jgi:tetratricopeptide (TPR) repeat protein
MSDGPEQQTSFIRPVQDLLAGRWQIPLAIVAAIAGAATLYNLVPPPPDVEFESLVADVRLLEEAGDLHAAADAVANLLVHEPPLPPDEQAVLHNKFADLIYAVESDAAVHDRANLEKLLASSAAAGELGHPITAQERLRDADALRWLGRDLEAIDELRGALGGDLRPEDKRSAVRSLVTLLDTQPDAKLERDALLESLLEEETISPAHTWWALQQAVNTALDQNDTLRARRLLERYGDRLTSSDLKGYLDWLAASILVHEGRTQEAEPIVNWIDTWLGEHARSTEELNRFGHLPSLNRWLTGRVHLAEDRPQDALEAFDAALRWRPEPEVAVAISVGRGLALGALDRHEAARTTFEEAARRLEKLPDRRRPALHAFQDALLELYRDQEAAGDFGNALPYLELAARLTPPDERERRLGLYEALGEACGAAAEATPAGPARREFHGRAGENYERAAGLVYLDEPHLADLLWSAALQYDEAGRLGSVRRVLEQFVPGRAKDERMPRALLLLGQAYEGFGDPRTAVGWYQQVIDQHPRLAARAKVLTSRALLSLGQEHYPRAEQLLTELLTEDHIDPRAKEFRAALLMLCELLYQQGRYAEAIGRLEDFRTLYPGDAERFRADFMLANAHRRSAYELRDNPPAGVSPEAGAAESRHRFESAAQLFDRLLEDLAQVDLRNEEYALYARLGLFYRGDCLFELNTPDTLRRALATYRNAAARYEGGPEALTAHVQIANIYLRLGDLREAERALERARWLLRSIPDEAYARAGTGDRAQWETLLTTVLTSDLFSEVATAAAP